MVLVHIVSTYVELLLQKFSDRSATRRHRMQTGMTRQRLLCARTIGSAATYVDAVTTVAFFTAADGAIAAGAVAAGVAAASITTTATTLYTSNAVGAGLIQVRRIY